MNERVERALNELSEYFDAICIVTSVYNPDAGQTERYHWSKGNAFTIERIMQLTLEDLTESFMDEPEEDDYEEET